MARRLLRKLTDVTTGEQLVAIKELLDAKHIPFEFQIFTGQTHDFYRVFVYVMRLQDAREALKELECPK